MVNYETYLFIDAEYLHKVVDKISRAVGRSIRVSYENLTFGYTRTFYYDCPPPKKKGESEPDFQARVQRHAGEIERIRFLDCCHVNVGTTAGVGERARQKGVDVKLAVDMLMHAIARNAQAFTLLSGDQDFKPLVDAVVNTGRRMIVWADKKSASNDLFAAADVRSFLTATELTARYAEKFDDEIMPLQHSSGQKMPHTAKVYGADCIWSSGQDDNGFESHIATTTSHGETIYVVEITQGEFRIASWRHSDYNYVRGVVEYDTGISLPPADSL